MVVAQRAVLAGLLALAASWGPACSPTPAPYEVFALDIEGCEAPGVAPCAGAEEVSFGWFEALILGRDRANIFTSKVLMDRRFTWESSLIVRVPYLVSRRPDGSVDALTLDRSGTPLPVGSRDYVDCRREQDSLKCAPDTGFQPDRFGLDMAYTGTIEASLDLDAFACHSFTLDERRWATTVYGQGPDAAWFMLESPEGGERVPREFRVTLAPCTASCETPPPEPGDEVGAHARDCTLE